MKKLGIIACLALAATSITAIADDAPVIQITNSSGSLNITLSSEGNGVWGFASPTTFQVGTASLTVNNVMIDSDPSISFAFSASNNPNAADNSVTAWQMNFPIIPLAVNLAPGQYMVQSSAAGSLTDGTTDGGTDGVTISPISGTPMIRSFIGGSDAGVDLYGTSINSGQLAFSAPFGPASASSTFNLASTATQMSVSVGFDLSGNDQASLTGRFDVVGNVNSVPEPSSVAMGFMAFGAFIVLSVRARRSRIT